MIRPFSQKKLRKRSYSQRSPMDVRPVSRRTQVTQWLLLVLAFLGLTAAITREPKQEEDVLSDIDLPVASREIQAQFDFKSVNLQATKEKQDAEMGRVPAFFRVDEAKIEESLANLRERMTWIASHRPEVHQAVLEALRTSTSQETAEHVVTRAVTDLAAALHDQVPWQPAPQASVLALWLMPDLATVPQRRFKDAGAGQAEARPVEALVPEDAPEFGYKYAEVLSRLATEGLEFVLAGGVRTEDLAPGEAVRRISILQDRRTDTAANNESALGSVPSAGTASEALSARLTETSKPAAKETAAETEWARLHEAALALAQPLVTANLMEDPVATAVARERARDSVKEEMKDIAAGEIIQERHKRWTPQSREDVRSYAELLESEERPGQRIVASLISHAIFVLLTLLCLNRAVNLRGWQASEEARKHYNVALLLIAGTLVVGRVVSYFEPTGFVLPIAATGILYAILVGVRLGAMVSFITAVLVSIQYGYDWRLLVVGSAMSLAGVFSIFRVRRRSDMAAASLKATLVGLVAIMAISLATDSLVSDASFRRFVLIALNGGICLLAVPGLLSPLERLFNITTDIQLLEYSDLNNELLSQLALKAPGTYAHSLMLGQLAEAAADAIGANGLLARVCAYYHDIGKMRRSEYFTENQTGQNIHDTISPRLSARAIAAHVIQGAEMAREYRLPKPIIDGILEHHGTCLIGYFYQQALENQKHGDVREKDFRYPGPKPQRPETAILMICDASESGVRSIKNPNEERVREFIDGIVDARAADGQFDECDLTLRQLSIIADVIAHRILGTLHTRVAYPARKKEDVEDNVIPLAGGSAAT